MTIVVTGSAGFIGAALTMRLLERGDAIVGIDNHNNYYDPEIKEARVARFKNNPNYTHIRINLSDKSSLEECFAKYTPERVVNLAAQAGVRYSIENPLDYVESNIVGFTNILEVCRMSKVKHLVYASSSSVYGANTRMPFSVHDSVNHPLSFYAATKKSNELMAHAYSHIHALPTTGLRFFTVYGPWGRPDMALFLFTKSIIEGKPIKVFNYGRHRRSFTYIDDIVTAIVRVLDKTAQSSSVWDSNQPDPATSSAPWRLYNIGNGRSVELLDYINAIEKALGKQAKLELVALQPGDVPDANADVSDLVDELDYKPETPIDAGVRSFIEWYREYFKV